VRKKNDCCDEKKKTEGSVKKVKERLKTLSSSLSLHYYLFDYQYGTVNQSQTALSINQFNK